VTGTEGYADEAEELFTRYEAIPAAENHRHVLHLMPKAPSRVLDVGSGTGRDAAWFASLGDIASSPSSRRKPCAFRQWPCIRRPGSNGSTTACLSWLACGHAAKSLTS
jgi:hypothetical protein